MEPEDYAIKVSRVYKDFQLPHEKTSSVKGIFTNVFQSNAMRTKETQHALKDINFQVKKGEFFGIVGRNGSGKSTLLKILAGIYQPNKGSVKVSGKLVPFIELGVGFNPELTGRENVYLNGALLGFARSEVDAMYQDIVDFAEIEKFMDQKLKNYSSGMQVRLAFSIATRSHADILLVDEVLAVGDTDFQRKCFDYFKILKKGGTTVVFVTHDMNAVREYCDRAVLIENSEIVLIGPAAKVAGEYSKLFMNSDDDNSMQNSKGKKKKLERWGEKSMEILGPSINKTEDNNLRLEFMVKPNQDIPDPILGYYFVDDFGNQICGVNTQILGKPTGPYLKGERYKISFEMLNIFNDGTYKVTIAALRNNGSVIADWWVDAVQLKIKKAQHIPFAIDLPVEFVWEAHK